MVVVKMDWECPHSLPKLWDPWNMGSWVFLPLNVSKIIIRLIRSFQQRLTLLEIPSRVGMRHNYECIRIPLHIVINLLERRMLHSIVSISILRELPVVMITSVHDSSIVENIYDKPNV